MMKQIPDLNTIDAVAGTDLFYCVDTSDTTDRAAGTGKKCTVAQIKILAVVIKTTTYIITSSDDVVVCNSATPFTVTLPAASGSGKKYSIKNINSGAVTVDGNSSDTIDGDANQLIYEDEAIQVVDYAANAWVII